MLKRKENITALIVRNLIFLVGRVSILCIALSILCIESCNETAAHHSRQPLFNWEKPVHLTEKENKLAHCIDTFFRHKVLTTGLNCCVLVANHGKLIYQNSFGYSDYKTKARLNDSSLFQLASVSKPFTATAILLLEEKGKLHLDDAVADYIDDFPYTDITIRMLLNHRSGLANYIYLFDTLKLPSGSFITNQHVVDYFLRNKPPLQALPGHKFQYCNTNYALLAYIIEQVSGESFADFLRDNIFLPAHMYHAYLRNVFDTTGYQNQTNAYIGSKWSDVTNVPYDGVYGDKGIYASAWDLYLFDEALNNGLLLKKESLEQSYKGYSYEKPGLKNYGLGWRLKMLPDSSQIIYHNGWWRGYSTLFVRQPKNELCIIILSNKFNRNVYDVRSLYELLNLSDPGVDSQQ